MKYKVGDIVSINPTIFYKIEGFERNRYLVSRFVRHNNRFELRETNTSRASNYLDDEGHSIVDFKGKLFKHLYF